jgi:mycothiol system anti-sigma-R factor
MVDHDNQDNQRRSNCEQALAEVYTFLDGELTAEKRVLIAGHLDSCNPCFEAFDFEAELRMVISAKARTDEVPETLRIRIAERLTILGAENRLYDGSTEPGDRGAGGSDDGTPAVGA